MKDFARRSIAWLQWGIPATVVMLGTILAYLPEWVRGKYGVAAVARSRAQAS